MISKIKVKNNPSPKQNKINWLNKITWALVMLFTVFIWQCKKDTFTGETTGICPTVLSTDPANEEVDVFTNKHITVTFNEVMDSATINTSTFLLKEGTNQVAGTVSYYGDAATFSPTANLKANTLYTGTITTGCQDPAGTALPENYTWTFKTGTLIDTLRPSVISTDPADGADDVVLNKIITAKFSKTMKASTINATTFLVKQGSTNIAGTVSLKGNIATFAPANKLAANTVYNATITTGAKDEAGVALAENYSWDFETGSITDATKPTVISTDPTNGATNVAVNKKITAVFSEAMNPSTINSITFLVKDGVKSVAGVVSYGGTTATFIPSAKLLSNTKYTATITTGAKDGAGNALAGNYTWNFTTGTIADTVRPTVISTDPIDKATNVSTGKNITAVFSENMDPLTINASVFLLKQGTTIIKGIVSLSGKTAMFNPSNDLMPNTL
ncbi:MAG: Ig-like domain-containing protein, partial [Bacteroidia bacterium]